MDTFERYSRSLQWCGAILLNVLASGCSGGRDPILGSGGNAALAPTVIAVTPVDGTDAIPLNIAMVSAVFSEPMAAIAGDATFALSCATPCTNPTGTVALDVTESIASLTLTPATSLEPLTLYTATLTGARSLATGVALASPYVWRFTTGAAADTTAPMVSSTSPLANNTAVAINTLITASFSESMNALTIDAATFTLACPAGTPITGTVSYSGNGHVATFAPASNLPSSTTCTATIAAGVEDIAANAMANAFSWSFTTGVTPDSTAPTVSSTSPFANDSGVAINTLITASFSEAMNPLTAIAANFTLACPAGTPIAGAVGYAVNGNVATFTPASDLPGNTTCTARIATGVRDVTDNALATAVSWSFTTAAAPDINAPTVSSTSPVANAAGVAINTLITASISEAMNPLTVTTANITLVCPSGTPITGTIGYAVNGNVATFTPASSLPVGTLCTATIATGVEDVAGNALVNPFSWTFTTGAAPDTTAPTVSSTSPLASANGVAINTLITADFSEAMDPLSIATATFTLACPSGTPIAGTVGYAVNGNIATFTPASDLPASTTCTAQITPGVTDVAHNAMSSLFSWIFTTGAAPDTIAPTVDSTNPADSAVGVCINKAINATFSEPIDPLTLTTASFTFTLATTAGASVTGVVAYDALTHIATFHPSANLIGTPATSYTATIKGGVGGVKDLAGNALAVDKVFTFTTNASTCTTAPPLSAAAPFGGFGGNATLTNDGLATVINGDIGVNAASTTITGLRDSGGNVYTITPSNNGLVNGLIYTSTAPPGSVPGDAVTHARADALAAFNSLSPANLTGGIDMANPAQCPSCGGAGGGADELAGRTLPPGVYLSATGTFDIGGAGRTTANLILDGGGDTNSVWVFQTTAGTGTLNVGLTGPAAPAVPIQVLLINGAQPKNVFWYVPAGAVIGTGSTLAGTLLSNAAITISTTGGSPPVTTLNGRAIALTAAVTMTNAVINVPAP